MGSITIVGYAAASSVLSNPHFVVPRAPHRGTPGGVAWLRAHVARFSSGVDHRRRRELVTAILAGVDPTALREAAFRRTSAVLRETDGQPIELMARVAKVVPVGLLAAAVDLPGAPVAAVAVIARSYPADNGADPAADEAVARLVEACGGQADEAAAARIGLLVQTHDATARLVGNTLLAVRRGRFDGGIDAVLDETLRHDPPVRTTRRVAAAATRVSGVDVPPGAQVRLDLAAANRDPAMFGEPDRFDPARQDRHRHLGFGDGPHACPGRAHATAIAAGIVDAARGCDLVDHDVAYEASSNLRVPVALVVSTR